MLKFVGGLVAMLLLLLIGAGVVILSGAYNVAATNPDNPVTEWLLHTTMRRSVAMRSSEIVAPQSFSNEQVIAGVEEFSAMCAQCHGAPGKMRASVGKGLRPRAPDLAVAAREWDSGSLFWIVKNGINMTGMPAFGLTHDDQTIWSIIAFVKQLPDMTSEEYQRLEQQSAAAGHKHQH